MIRKKYPKAEELHHRFTYSDGELYWETPKSARLQVGDLAGDKDGKGYRRITIGSSQYKMHVFIWIMHYGDNPEHLIVDHYPDTDISNNRIENLRLTTKSGNTRNRKIPIRGTSYDKFRDKWRAQITVDGKNNMLGRFDTEEEAHAEYLRAVESLSDEFN